MSIANFDSQNYIKCKLELTSKSEMYYPGDKISGVLTALCTKNVFFYGFQVCLNGNAIVKFTNPGSEEQTEDTNFYCNETEILGNPIFYDPSVPGMKKKFLLTPGTYTFPFDFRFPPNELPCSFENPNGIIRYQVIGLTRDDAGPYRKVAQKIYLRPLFNPNDPRLGTPFLATKAESTFFGKPQLSITLEAQKSIFHPREKVPFKIRISNSTSGVPKATITFAQRMVFKSKSESKITNKDYFTFELEGRDEEWTKVVEFPGKIVPTQFGEHPNPRIELTYMFKIEVRMKKPAKIIKAEIPITIVSEPRSSKSNHTEHSEK